jgi:polar amino acid transport system substrate-binding protein
MTTQLGSLLISAILLCLAAPVLAKDKLIIGVENQFYLPIYAYDQGQYHGFARDLFDAFAQDRGYQVEYRALPVPRLYAAFFSGQVDFKFPDNPLWKQQERNGKKISYSAPVAAFVDGISVLPRNANAGIDQIKHIGTMSGFTPWAWMSRIKTGDTRLSENTHLQALIKQTLAGRNDGAYASVAVINYQLDHVLKQPGALVFNPALPNDRDNYYLSSIKRPEVLNEFNHWQQANRTRIAAMKKQYGVEKGL